MTNVFAQALKAEAGMTQTENGALTHVSSGSAVLDFFASGGAMRKRSENDITQMFELALLEDRNLALKTLFYLRDVRGGQGERRTFRVCLEYLRNNHKELFNQVALFVPEFGRWDDYLPVLDDNYVQMLIRSQLTADLKSERPSLMAKWLPSENTSSKKTREYAKKAMKFLGLTPRNYRRTLSRLREKLNIVEREMCAKRWGSIIYSHVPSNASLRYRKAFKKRDSERYTEYLSKVQVGAEKINSGTLYPYDLVHEVWGKPGDQTIDLQWASLPNYMKNQANALVVADVSGSMSGKPMEVCISLALYIAERNKGPFNNTFMTFSASPEIQQIRGNTLYEKVQNLSQAAWQMNTNIQACFDRILQVAQASKATQEDIPQMLLIISDMEFDRCVSGGVNFNEASLKFERCGYKLPTIVFWTVDSRNRQQPVRKHQSGAMLVSGCSPSILKQVMNFAQTPYDLMLETLNSDRYAPIKVN